MKSGFIAVQLKGSDFLPALLPLLTWLMFPFYLAKVKAWWVSLVKLARAGYTLTLHPTPFHRPPQSYTPQKHEHTLTSRLRTSGYRLSFSGVCLSGRVQWGLGQHMYTQAGRLVTDEVHQNINFLGHQSQPLAFFPILFPPDDLIDGYWDMKRISTDKKCFSNIYQSHL